MTRGRKKEEWNMMKWWWTYRPSYIYVVKTKLVRYRRNIYDNYIEI